MDLRVNLISIRWHNERALLTEIHEFLAEYFFDITRMIWPLSCQRESLPQQFILEIRFLYSDARFLFYAVPTPLRSCSSFAISF